MRIALIWALAFLAATLLVTLHPAGLGAVLDRGSILTIAGLNVVAVSVTFGVVGLQRQHFAETYTVAVTRNVARRERWPAGLIFQAVGVMYAVITALIAPTLATGIAATILLAVGLIESGRILAELLRQFDIVQLLVLAEAGSLDALKAPGGTRSYSMISAVESILDLMVRGAERADTVVVDEGMKAWCKLFCTYLSQSNPPHDNTLYIDWQFDRTQELIETYARKSAGVVLPLLIEGTVYLGACAAEHARSEDETSKTVDNAVRCLKAAAVTSVESHLAASARQSVDGIVRIAEAHIHTRKVGASVAAIEALRAVALELEPALNLAQYVAAALAQLVCLLATKTPGDAIFAEAAEDSTYAIREVMSVERTGGFGPIHALTEPSAMWSLPLLVYSTAVAATKDKSWRDVCVTIALLTFDLTKQNSLDLIVGTEVEGCCAGVLIALMLAPQEDLTLRILVNLVPSYVDLIRRHDSDRLHVERGLEQVLLTAFYVRRLNPSSADTYTELIRQIASGIASCDKDRRLLFASALRTVGAAAIHAGDEGLAQLLAQASLPGHPTELVFDNLPIRFQASYIADASSGYRPGLPQLPTGTDHFDEAAQRRFSDLERKNHEPV